MSLILFLSAPVERITIRWIALSTFRTTNACLTRFCGFYYRKNSICGLHVHKIAFPIAMRSLKNQKFRINETEFLLQYGVRVCCLHLYIVYIVFFYTLVIICVHIVCVLFMVCYNAVKYLLFIVHINQSCVIKWRKAYFQKLTCSNSRKSKFYKTLHKTLQVC